MCSEVSNPSCGAGLAGGVLDLARPVGVVGASGPAFSGVRAASCGWRLAGGVLDEYGPAGVRDRVAALGCGVLASASGVLVCLGVLGFARAPGSGVWDNRF